MCIFDLSFYDLAKDEDGDDQLFFNDLWLDKVCVTPITYETRSNFVYKREKDEKQV